MILEELKGWDSKGESLLVFLTIQIYSRLALEFQVRISLGQFGSDTINEVSKSKTESFWE